MKLLIGLKPGDSLRPAETKETEMTSVIKKTRSFFNQEKVIIMTETGQRWDDFAPDEHRMTKMKEAEVRDFAKRWETILNLGETG